LVAGDKGQNERWETKVSRPKRGVLGRKKKKLQKSHRENVALGYALKEKRIAGSRCIRGQAGVRSVWKVGQGEWG